MPQTTKKTGPELAIELDGRQGFFYTGDTITGRVVRQAYAVAPNTQLQISLVGCAQNAHSNRGSRHRFFGPDETGIRLYHGPVHIPPNGDPLSWPFTLTIPTRMSSRAAGLSSEQRQSNLLFGAADIEAQTMPGSFSCAPYASLFVEYYLEAIFRMQRDSSVEVSTATVPVTIRSRSPPLPVSGFAFKRWSQPACVITPRLLPGMQEAELTLRQMAQRLVGSSRVPRLGYSLEVQCPSVLQIANVTPISFRIRVVPDASRSSHDVVDSKAPFTLVSLGLRLYAETGPLDFHGRDMTSELDFRLDIIPWRTVFGEPLVLPSRADEEPLDLGELLQLRVGTWGATAVGKAHNIGFGRELYPSFTTFNIKHSHRLRWQVVIGVAGEEMTHWSESRVTVKAPSGDVVDSTAATRRRGADVEPEEILPAYGPAREELERPPGYVGQEGNGSGPTACRDIREAS